MVEMETKNKMQANATWKQFTVEENYYPTAFDSTINIKTEHSSLT